MATLQVLVLLGYLLTFSSAVRDLPGSWKDDIEALKDPIDQIINYVSTDNKAISQAYNRLAHLTDIYGPRPSGSQALEDAIDYLKDEMVTEFGAGNVETEDVSVPHWVRGEEKAWLDIPQPGGKMRRHNMYIMGIGTSVGTDGQDLTAPIVVVNSLSDLDNCNDTKKFEGKIVVYNQEWPEDGYLGVYMYRGEGGYRAQQCGAVAALVRSLTGLSVYSPHTGTQSTSLNSTIPAACVTVEDAELLNRLTTMHNKDISVTINMEAINEARKTSRNLWAKIDGQDKKDEYVIFGGHIDSWDVGNGAMDDGGGVVISWQALTVIKELVAKNLIPQPKRTMMSIFWTAEEVDSSGANLFFENNKDKKVSLIMESDAGTFSPTGVGFSGSGLAKAIMEEIMAMLKPINADKVTENMLGSVDLAKWLEVDQTAVVLNNNDSEYFNFHHTHGDSITVEDPDELDRCSIMWTSVAYAVASLHDVLPTEGDYVSGARSVTNSHGMMILMFCFIILVRVVSTKQ